MCPGCGGEEDIIIQIRRFSVERDEFLFTCVFMFDRESWYE